MGPWLTSSTSGYSLFVLHCHGAYIMCFKALPFGMWIAISGYCAVESQCWSTSAISVQMFSSGFKLWNISCVVFCKFSYFNFQLEGTTSSGQWSRSHSLHMFFCYCMELHFFTAFYYIYGWKTRKKRRFRASKRSALDPDKFSKIRIDRNGLFGRPTSEPYCMSGCMTDVWNACPLVPAINIVNPGDIHIVVASPNSYY